jgi:hypothetical protein
MFIMHRLRIRAFVPVLATLLTAGTATADSAVTVRQTADLFPYEIGLGGLIAVTAAFLLGRMCRPAAPRRQAAPLTPSEPIRSSNAGRPINLIRRLDELEKLRDLGILSGEEFETEKHKLRKL